MLRDTNRVINGSMRIDQRFNGSSSTPTGGAYNVDRWGLDLSVGSKLTVGRNLGGATPPSGYSHYLGISVASAYTPATSELFSLRQAIEGFNCADFAWGTAAAQAVTLSFWVQSSLTGTFSGAIENGAFNYSYPFTYTINAANTWEYKTVTIPGPTAGTWATDNTSGVNVQFSMGAGATYQAAAGAWIAADDRAATGAVQLVTNAGATWRITGVQLELGSIASPFQQRHYAQELALCQRYLPAFNHNGGGDRFLSPATSTTGSVVTIPFLVTPRVVPTGVTVSSVAHFTVYNYVNGTSGSPTAITLSVAGAYNASLSVTTSAGSPTLAAGNTVALYSSNAAAQLLFTGCEL